MNFQNMQKYNMYIIFGMTEKDEAGTIKDNGVEKVYNSAAILYPNGKIDSYQKIHRAGQENKWSVTGKTPKIIETKWGKIGVDICRDGHFYPELDVIMQQWGAQCLSILQQQQEMHGIDQQESVHM